MSSPNLCVNCSVNAIRFYWITLDETKNLKVYPEKAAELLMDLDEPLKHLAYLEIINKSKVEE